MSYRHTSTSGKVFFVEQSNENNMLNQEKSLLESYMEYLKEIEK